MPGIRYSRKNGQLQFGKYAAKAGMDWISDDGLACMGNRYSVLYEITGNTADFFQIMRFYDISFQILMDMADGKKYLKLTENYESREHAGNDLQILETDIRKNLQCSLERTDLQKRMRLLQRMSAGDSGYLRTDDYTHGGDWIREICMMDTKEVEECMEFGSGQKNYYQIFSLKEPLNISEGLVLSGRNLRYLVIEVFPVSDQGIRLYMKDLYLGLETMEKQIKAHSPALWEVMFVPAEKDQRYFTLVDVSFVRSACTEEFTPLDRKKFNSCHGRQKEMYQAVVQGVRKGLPQTRVCPSDEAASAINSILEKEVKEWYPQEKNS